MYVPGYGFGAAEDIGGAIKGMHIDVCFDDADWGKGLWSTRYVDVYLLTPVPPEHKIAWILPP
jgi:3D (Asp-Asp-Asp) domain-containing protein